MYLHHERIRVVAFRDSDLGAGRPFRRGLGRTYLFFSISDFSKIQKYFCRPRFGGFQTFWGECDFSFFSNSKNIFRKEKVCGRVERLVGARPQAVDHPEVLAVRGLGLCRDR